jgi:hypothetical protein
MSGTHVGNGGRDRSAAQRAMPATRGVVFMHCVPSAVAPHVEWALGGVLGHPVKLDWSTQHAAPAHLRAEATWTGPIGTGARLAGSLRAWPMLVFEVTEDATWAGDGERLSYLPGRGFHRRMTSANGDVVVGEERLRGLLARCGSVEDYRQGLDDLLGTAWDIELEPYRMGGEGSPVTLVHSAV